MTHLFRQKFFIFFYGPCWVAAHWSRLEMSILVSGRSMGFGGEVLVLECQMRALFVALYMYLL